jgi:hypothetical protein
VVVPLRLSSGLTVYEKGRPDPPAGGDSHAGTR